MAHFHWYILLFSSFTITKCHILQLKDFKIMLDKQRKRLWTTYVRKLHRNCLGKIETFHSSLTAYNKNMYNCLCHEICLMKANDLNEDNCVSRKFTNNSNHESKFIIFDGTPEYITDNDKIGIRDLNQVVGYINSSYDMMYGHFSAKTPFHYERWELTWMLELNSLIQLFQWNFTLVKFNLAYSIPDCLTEHVALRHHRFFSYIHEKKNLYCGKLSVISIYLTESSYNVSYVNSGVRTHSMFTLLYQICDKNLIKTVHTAFHCHYINTLTLQAAYFFKNKTSVNAVNVYYVTASKLFTLAVKLKGFSSRLKIFDGPVEDQRFSVRVHRANEIYLSTFHCVIVHSVFNYDYSDELDETLERFLTYKSKPPLNKPLIISISLNKQKIFQVPKSNCQTRQGNHCVAQIQAPQGYSIYITSLNIMFTGPMTGSCTFAGLSFYQLDKEYLLFCKSSAASSSYFQNQFTSYNESMTVVLYATSGYVSVNCSLNVTTTACTGITINTCELNLYCRTTKLKYDRFCLPYLKPLSSSDKIELWMEDIVDIIYSRMTISGARTAKEKGLISNQSPGSCLMFHFSTMVSPQNHEIIKSKYFSYFLSISCSVTLYYDTKKVAEQNVILTQIDGRIEEWDGLYVEGKGLILSQNYFERSSIDANNTLDTSEPLTQAIYRSYRMRNRIADIDLHILSNPSTLSGRFRIRFLTTLGTGSGMVLKVSYQKSAELKKNNIYLQSLSEWQQIASEYLGNAFPLNNSIICQHARLTDIYIDDKYLLEILSLNLHIKVLNLPANVTDGYITTIIFETKYCVKKWMGCDSYLDEEIFYEAHLNKCSFNHTLQWQMPVTASTFRAEQSMNISLGGYIRTAKFDFDELSPDVVASCPKCYFMIRWIDKKILTTVPSTLILDSKEYSIYPSTDTVGRRYSWFGAEKFCNEHGAHLPSFSSKTDVLNLIRILERAVWTGPIRVIFIGLNMRVSNKHTFLFFNSFTF